MTTVRRGPLVLAAVLVVGLLAVGLGHWRLHSLENRDVIWRADSVEGDVAVVGERVYVAGRSGYAVHDLTTGEMIHQDGPRSSTLWVGEDGHVLVDSALDQFRLLSPEGEELWRRQLDGGPAALDGDSVVLRRCEDDACTVVGLDAQGQDAWEVDGDAVRWVMRALTMEDGIGWADSRLTALPPLAAVVHEGEVMQVRDGAVVGGSLPVSEDAEYALVGEQLVVLSAEGGTCDFRSLQAGEPSWESSVECPRMDPLVPPWVVPFDDTLMVGDRPGSAEGSAIAVDMATGETSALEVPLLRDADQAEDTFLLPGAVVLRDQREVTAWAVSDSRSDSVSDADAEGGFQQLWTQEVRGRARDVLDPEREIQPGVRASGDAVMVLADSTSTGLGRLWELLAVGRDLPRTTTTVLDLETGDRVARVAAPSQYSVTSIGDGRALMLADGELMLIGWD